MKRIIVILMCVAAFAMNSFTALAQQSYPEDIFDDDPLDGRVSYTGKSPKIGDFLLLFLNQDWTSEVFGELYVAWEHYKRQEPQEPCRQFMVDEKNGFFRHTYDSELCEDIEDGLNKGYIEMCYWNCADGKHKLIAQSCYDTKNGLYFNTEYCGITFFLYDNASRKIWQVPDMYLGAEVSQSIDEYDSAIDTGKPLTVYEDGYESVVVYRLPQQGKDINVEIYSGTKKAEVRLVWDGMRFNQEKP